MSNNIVGKIYILTNPSFPDYVKIGYSNDVENRIRQLNNSEAVPFAFRLYATYDVEVQSADKILHKIIDKLNSDLRSVDTVNDKVRVREFYLISPEDAYELLDDIALISGTQERLHLYRPTQEEVDEEETAESNRELSKNRHHFKEITFKSSLTNKTYYSKTKDDGTLGIYEEWTDKEVPNNSNPSKKQILLQAVKDLNEEVKSDATLYQLQHQLEKLLLKENYIDSNVQETLENNDTIMVFGKAIKREDFPNVLREKMKESIGMFTEREANVLKMRFGIEDGISKTIDEVADKFEITRERVRQIEAKALRKLNHPQRGHKERW